MFLLQRSQVALLFLLLFFSGGLVIVTTAPASISFNFPRLDHPTSSATCRSGLNAVCLQGDARGTGTGAIQFTRVNISGSIGRAYYSEPLHLWDKTNGQRATFSTRFTFEIDTVGNDTEFTGGLTFFLTPYPSSIPADSTGGFLGLVSPSNFLNASGDTAFVAVEFDSSFGKSQVSSAWDPEYFHMGIDINNLKAAVDSNISDFFVQAASRGDVVISYEAVVGGGNLTVTLVDLGAGPNSQTRNYSMSHLVDFKEFLPDWVAVGFSATAGVPYQLNKLLSWKFESSFGGGADPGQPGDGAKTVTTSKKSNLGILIGAVLGAGGLIIAVVALFWLIVWRNKRDNSNDSEIGPRKFPYTDLANATDNFDARRKLGEGGFGAVYRGFLSNLNMEVAIKRISRDSKQGKKEYEAEIQTISRLRHRNILQIIGWCHDDREFLLVYEFMPKGSLDTHLFNTDNVLPWDIRYRIAVGLASALHYLQEECEQYVVHRDIKSSNVMLDADFNPKLGDFGLARLTRHGSELQTTLPGGTMGYMAPECLMMGNSSKKSDIYSFGIVALEIACGRKPIEHTEVGERRVLVEWVWRLYGVGEVLGAADTRLGDSFEVDQMEQLMLVGLWCANPTPNRRPGISDVIQALKFEKDVPPLPNRVSLRDPAISSTTGISQEYSHASTSHSFQSPITWRTKTYGV